MIEQEFNARYPNCNIDIPTEYTMNNITAFAVFCVDCIFTAAQKSASHCDEFIFFNIAQNTTGIFLVERKKNTCHDVEKVRKQLQGGACFITAFVTNDPAFRGHSHNFKPVLVSKGIKSSHRDALNRKKISLLGKKERIVHVQTNKALPPIK